MVGYGSGGSRISEKGSRNFFVCSFVCFVFLFNEKGEGGG